MVLSQGNNNALKNSRSSEVQQDLKENILLKRIKNFIFCYEMELNFRLLCC